MKHTLAPLLAAVALSALLSSLHSRLSPHVSRHMKSPDRRLCNLARLALAFVARPELACYITRLWRDDLPIYRAERGR